MTNKNKARGNNLEREVVKLCEEYGFKAKRSWGSNGEALGEDKEVDVLIDVPRVRVQCKRHKKLPIWLKMDKEKYDIVWFRMDGRPKKHYVMLDAEDYLGLWTRIYDLQKCIEETCLKNSTTA